MSQTPLTQCRYYLHGVCRDGESCRFAHSISARPDSVCRFYLRGQCSYGSGCRYDHIRDRSDRARNSNNGSSSIQLKHRDNCLNNKVSTDKTHETSSSSTERPFLSTSKNETCSHNHSITDTKLRADAIEFIPSSSGFEKPETYAQALLCNNLDFGIENEGVLSDKSRPQTDLMCPYNMMGHCWYGDSCSFLHGEICDLCNAPALHPHDKELRAQHRKECIANHELEMESAFAEAKSREMQCGICMEIVLEKHNSAMQRFGILPGCKHCFCLECIRRWRQAKSFEHKIIRACPECRTVSDFVVPSSCWVDSDSKKKELIDKYLAATKEKPCKYFMQGSTSNDGEEECPFGNKCFYKHQKPDGTIVEGDSPRDIRARQRLRRQRQRTDSDSNADLLAVWSFLRHREASGTSSEDGNSASGAAASGGDEWRLQQQFDLLALAGREWRRTGPSRDQDDPRLGFDYDEDEDDSSSFAAAATADWFDDV